MIYTEPSVLTGGGPGNATTFLSIDLVKVALGQFDLGPAAAMSIIYFLIVAAAQLGLLHADDAQRGAVMTDASRAVGNDERHASAATRARAARRSGQARLAGADALHHLPDGADLLAAQHVVQDDERDPRRLHALAAQLHPRELPRDPDQSGLVQRLHQLDHLCHHQHGDLGDGRAAGGLRLLALPLPRRQAPVLLAADQPHGAAGGVRAAVLSSSIRRSGCSTRISPWRSRTACSTSRSPCGSSKASCRACRRRSTRPPISTAIRSRASS